MNKSTIIFGLGGLVVGSILGYVAGYYTSKKKSEEEINYILQKKKEEENKETKEEPVVTPEKQEEKKTSFDPSKIVSPGPAKIAMPGEDGIDYVNYCKKVEELKYKAESESPKDSDEDNVKDDEELNPEDFKQTYEERILQQNMEVSKEFETYKKQRKKKYYILSHGVDEDYPDIQFEKQTLFYFTMDDVLTDEEGNFVDEKDLIGPDLRKYGWFINKNMVETTVRNMEDEIDYEVKKEFTSFDDFFPEKANIPIEDDEEGEENEE